MNLQQLYVYTPSPKCRIKQFYDIAIYSYLMYRDEWGNFPSALNISEHVGLDRGTVKNCVDRLQSLDLIQSIGGGKHQIIKPKEGEFIKVNSPLEEKHWRYGFAFWKCLVRETNSELTFNDVAIYSYMLSISDKLSGSYGNSYFEKVLTLDRKTVAASLRRLNQIELVRDGKKRQVRPLDKLTEQQRKLFRHAAERGRLEFEEWQDEPKPENKTELSISGIETSKPPASAERIVIDNSDELDEFFASLRDSENVDSMEDITNRD